MTFFWVDPKKNFKKNPGCESGKVNVNHCVYRKPQLYLDPKVYQVLENSLAPVRCSLPTTVPNREFHTYIVPVKRIVV